MSKKRKIRKQRLVLISNVHPNSWNFNEQSEDVYRAELESIKRNGFVYPITVREHPGKDGCYEIIDGEHRWKAAKQLKYELIPIISFGKITDQRAKGLSVTFNETTGKPREDELAKIIAEIEGDPDIRAQLPYSDKEIEGLIELAGMDVGDAGISNEAGEEGGLEGDDTVSVILYPDAKDYEVWRQLVSRLSSLFPGTVKDDKDTESAITLAALVIASMTDKKVKKHFEEATSISIERG